MARLARPDSLKQLVIPASLCRLSHNPSRGNEEVPIGQNKSRDLPTRAWLPGVAVLSWSLREPSLQTLCLGPSLLRFQAVLATVRVFSERSALPS